MKTVTKLLGGALLAGAAFAAPVQAQLVSYTTAGSFTGSGGTCNNAAFTPTATCAFGGFTLTFVNEDANNLGNGTASLGTFTLVGSGANTPIPSGTMFALQINQTSPSVGTGVTRGVISGTVQSAPPTTSGNVSTLIWLPDRFVNIGSTTYALVFDASGPAAGRGLAIPFNNPQGSTRGINVEVTATPEPASMALLGTGLLGVFGFARRRKSMKA